MHDSATGMFSRVPCTGVEGIFDGPAELSEVSGTGRIYIDLVQSLIGVVSGRPCGTFGRMFVEQIPPVRLVYVPSRTYPN